MDVNEEFQITPEELERIKSAMNNKIFRDMLIEYANEISDPANKKKYEEEIIAMEKQRGQEVKLIKPQSGFVVKTVCLKDNLKTFINICTSPEVGEYSSEKGVQNGLSGLHVKLPHSLVPCRKDYDKDGKQCIVYDVCFNPKSYERALHDEAFRSILIDTSFDAIEKQAGISFDRKNRKFPKMKYKGTPQPSILRSTELKQGENKETSGFNYPARNIEKKNSQKVKKDSEIKLNENHSTSTKLPITPKFNIIHRGFFDMQDFTNTIVSKSRDPKELVVEIYLPLAEAASGIDLDIFEKQLVLNSNNPSYHLDIKLPYKINENLGCAQFDKGKRILIVTLPVISEPNINIDTKSSLVTLADENHTDQNEVIKNDPECFIEYNETRKHDEEHGEKNTQVANLTPMNEHSENLKFDSSVIDYLPGTSQLPPFSCHQTLEEVLILITIQDIKVEDLSIGFTEHQVCVSFSQNSDEKTSLEWSMVIRSEDIDFFDKTDCGFDISLVGLELHLRKSVRSIRLWNKIFIGASETELKMETFLTKSNSDSPAHKEAHNGINSKKLCENNSSEQCENDNAKCLENVTLERLENQLEKLLILQDTIGFDDNVDNFNDQDEVILDKHFVKTELNGSSPVLENSETIDNDYLNISLMDLHDDVIDSSSSSPCSPYQVCITNTRFYTRHVSDCSTDEDAVQRKALLKSILKRSKSDDTDYESAKTSTNRTRAKTMSDEILLSSQEDVYKRRRYKSVTFSEEPIVFEFDKLSKRQWKKKAKLEKQRESSDAKPDNLVCNARVLSSPAVLPVSSPQILASQSSGKVSKKQSKKAKRKEKRNSSSSMSDKELDSEELHKKLNKKKKKKIKNVQINNTSIKCDVKTEKVDSTLDNQMIFDLE
ncbi:protein kintoun isoform X1 [Hydra vulgaris]|uniref:protein kintoun isoform X1 n=2 Tax=Hydra vulgaris TaxID=6087 RepID=UPI001F5F5DF0|nr:protein kintoun [Hydra vulgaris]